EPEGLGGTDAGPNPVEYVLGALAACQEIVIKAHAVALGIDVKEVSVEVEGNIDLNGFLNLSDARAGFTDINYITKIKTDEKNPEKLEQLRELSFSRCPVLDIIKNPVPVNGEVQFV
ncbi:MAG: OsmC family protein, partial [Balneolaceae bacterium]